MSKSNASTRHQAHTHEGGVASPHLTVKQQLERTVISCMLFEDTFYEKGSDIATRIRELVAQNDPDYVSALAVFARAQLGLRHVALWLAVSLLDHPHASGETKQATVDGVIRRADEMGEIMAMFRRQHPRKKFNHALRKGIRKAFTKFNGYQLAKYNRPDAQFKLRDMLFLSHPKPVNDEQQAIWNKLVEGKLDTPDTWEVQLSAGGDKREVFERLLDEGKIGYLALLRNLRNMDEAGVPRAKVMNALLNGNQWGILPHQLVAAYRFCPEYAHALDKAMERLTHGYRLHGTTVIVIDVSGSMYWDNISKKSKLTRVDAAAALAVLTKQVCDDAIIYTFSNDAALVTSSGLSMVEEINANGGGGTWLSRSLKQIKRRMDVPKKWTPDRLIVITDEQAHDGIPEAFCKRNYLVNVASYRPGLDTTQGWTRINGFSHRLLEFIAYEESLEDGVRSDSARAS